MGLPSSRARATPAAPIQTRHDDRVVILDSYPSWAGLQLHSLAVAAEYRCDQCRKARESTMIATGENTVICPACYAELSRAAAAAESPAQLAAHAG